jgi:hypothetical protein
MVMQRWEPFAEMMSLRPEARPRRLTIGTGGTSRRSGQPVGEQQSMGPDREQPTSQPQ